VSRLEKTMKGGRRLIIFIVAGDPDIEQSFRIACDAIDSGADILELGMPFSDPLADGPTIQRAGQRALASGMNTDRYFELVERINKVRQVPLVCLTYYNIILNYGLEKFSQKCKYSGIEGVIVPDLPIEEAGDLIVNLKKYRIDFIFLVAQTTTDDRLAKIISRAGGFIYIVSLLGTTGSRRSINPELQDMVLKIRKMTDIPLAVGFGVSEPAHVSQILSFGADGVICGSAVIKKMEASGNVIDYIRALKSATG